MTDAIRELFELLTKKEKSGSDYTGTVTRVDGKTAYVQFDGSDITDTPVALSIGAKAGDSVRVRVADGRAWLVGNDDAPPNDSSEVGYELALTNALIRQLTTEQINGENGWINLLLGTFNYGNGKLAWNGQTLSIDGKITSSNGKIGGWNIGQSSLSSTSPTGNLVDIANGSNTHQDVLVVRTGAGTTASPYRYPFYLRATGFLHTESLDATGGTIGGWSIASDKLYKTFTSSGGDSITISLNPSLSGISIVNSTSNRELRIEPDSIGIADYASHYITNISQTTIAISGGSQTTTIAPHGITTDGTVIADSSITAGGSIWAEQSTKNAQANCGVNHSGLGGVRCYLTANGSSQGIYSSGYYNGSSYSESGLWLLERDSNGRVKVPSYSGTRSYPIVSNSTVVGNRVGGLVCNTATQLSIQGDWKLTDGTSKYMYVTVGSSDPRLKHDITPTEMNALELIDTIPLKAFTWNDTNKHWDVGFIAPELYEIDPNLAIRPDDEDEGYWGVDDFYLTGIQTKAIQELHAEINSLKAEIAELKEIIAVLMEGKK